MAAPTFFSSGRRYPEKRLLIRRVSQFPVTTRRLACWCRKFGRKRWPHVASAVVSSGCRYPPWLIRLHGQVFKSSQLRSHHGRSKLSLQSWLKSGVQNTIHVVFVPSQSHKGVIGTSPRGSASHDWNGKTLSGPQVGLLSPRPNDSTSDGCIADSLNC